MIRVRGRGPVYFGVERELTDPATFTRAWLVEDLPPFRRSTRGFRVRVWFDTAVHFGLCHYGEDPHRRLPVPPDEIGRWGVQTETATDPVAEQAGQLEPGGCLDAAGDEPRGVDHPVP